MRTCSLLCILLALSLLLVPAFAVTGVQPGGDAPENSPAGLSGAGEPVKVFSSSTGKISSLPAAEYLTGVVAAEMSPKCHTEALKAQALAAYTYTLYVKNANGAGGNSKLGGADISDSPASHQGYYSREERKKRWGDAFEENEKKIADAVAAVLGKCITYDGKPILAVYFDRCRGCTQSAQELWGNPIPYLVSVQSPGDRLSPSLTSTVELTNGEFEKKLKALTGSTPEGTPGSRFGRVEESESGYVTRVTLCGREFSGWEIREAFALKSNAFTVKETESTVTFTVQGSGHSVGMSQYGADYMARQGSSFEEIIFHYYPGTMIESE